MLDARQIELDVYNTVMETIGKPVVFNIAILGALLGIYPVVKTESVSKILQTKFPGSFHADNARAFDVGLELGSKHRD